MSGATNNADGSRDWCLVLGDLRGCFTARAEADTTRVTVALHFEAPDFSRFPLLSLAYRSQEAGGTAGCTLNAADEVAVEAFLREQIPFPAIAAVVEDTLSAMPYRDAASIHDLLEIDRRSRSAAEHAVLRRAGRRATVAIS